MSALWQSLALTALGFEAARARAASHATALLGTAGVVAIVVTVLSASEGLKKTFAAGVDPDTVLVLRGGAGSELLSVLPGEEARIIESRPEWRAGDEGPAVSAELFLVVALAKREGGAEAAVTLRGVGPAAYRVRDRFSIVAGRRLLPGRNEVIVGVRAQESFRGLSLGALVAIAGERWPVVGVFETGGRADSEIWGDAGVVQGRFRRGNTIQALYAKPADPAALARVRRDLDADPRVDVEVHLQSSYYAAQAETMTRVIDGFAILLGVVMGAGAVFAILDTMYASIDGRRRELATLRALGFSRRAIVASVVSESLVVGLLGGAGGCLVASLVVDGFRATTLDFRSFSQVAFTFATTPSVLARGVALATLLGIAGGLLPALRAIRTPIARGLRV